MFSFVIFDKKYKTIFLVRDRIGKKPLYYSLTKNFLCFGSEIRSLIIYPEIKLNIDKLSLNDYFSKGYIGYNRTIYSSIKQVPAGSFIKFDLNFLQNCKPEYYWELPTTEKYNQYSEIELIDRLDALLTNSIKIRMQSDVPLGLFLSGGLDSSLIVAIASNLYQKPLETFSIGFSETQNDETKYAEKIAKFYGTNHETFKINH